MFAAKTEGIVSAFSRTVNSIQQTVAVVGIAVMLVSFAFIAVYIPQGTPVTKL
jgi:hypothetical protein